MRAFQKREALFVSQKAAMRGMTLCAENGNVWNDSNDRKRKEMRKYDGFGEKGNSGGVLREL